MEVFSEEQCTDEHLEISLYFATTRCAVKITLRVNQSRADRDNTYRNGIADVPQHTDFLPNFECDLTHIQDYISGRLKLFLYNDNCMRLKSVHYCTCSGFLFLGWFVISYIYDLNLLYEEVIGE
jgi:hypothetical protein